MQQQHRQQYHQHMGFEESPSGNSGGRVSLLIRHLPEAIPEETLFRLLSHYGASSVRSCAVTGWLRNCAFVDFQNKGLAYQAQQQLNGLRFLGMVLKVERAATNNDNPSLAANKDSTSVNTPSKPSLVHNATTKIKGEEIEGSRSEPVAPRLGVDHPFPPQLEYAYLPPDGNILANIVNALIAVPRFYAQVLHLMNKMNVPAPFRIALPSPPLPPSVPVPLPPPPPLLAEKPRSTDISSEDSEMESSDEEVKDKSYSRASSGRKRLKSLLGSIDAAKSGLSMKLMQEGRMRGQAFVTFPSVELAHYALTLVNGYVFKGKPMIIQFGRNPVAGRAK